jgi:hypothetical protein
MSPSIAELRKLDTKSLIALHDSAAKNTVVGTGYYLDEIMRRDQAESDEKMLKLTEDMHRMTRQMTVTAYIALVVAVVGLLVAVYSVIA